MSERLEVKKVSRYLNKLRGESRACSQSCRHPFTLYLSYVEVWKPCGVIWHFVIRLIMFPAGSSPSNLRNARTHTRTAPGPIHFSWVYGSVKNWTPRMQKGLGRISTTYMARVKKQKKQRTGCIQMERDAQARAANRICALWYLNPKEINRSIHKLEWQLNIPTGTF